MTLRGLVDREPVALRGRVAGGNKLLSPITSQVAAVIRWQLVERGERDSHGALLDEGFFGDVFVVGTPDGLVQVPCRHLRVYFAAGGAAAWPVPRLPPQRLRRLMTSARAHALAARGELFYREEKLMSGRAVRLRAVVAPLGGGGGYRVAADADFVVCDELEVPVVSVDVPEMA